MRKRAMLTIGLLVGGLAVTGPAPPVAAAVTVTASGGAVTAAVTGAMTVTVGCVSGTIRVGNVASTPSRACGAVTSLTITGDGLRQIVNASGAGNAAFSSLTSVTLSTGGGDDLIFSSTRRDTVIGGAGNDQLLLDGTGAADGPLVMGGDASDSVIISGGAANEAFTLDTGSPTTETDVVQGPWSTTIVGAPFVSVVGGAGHDTVDASGLTASTTIVGFAAHGETGDDTLLGGAATNTLGGGSGTNLLVGGPGNDVLNTESPTDTVRGQGGTDRITDGGTARVGSRTLQTPGSPDDTWTLSVDGDAAIRTRASGAQTTVTAAITRTGRQILDAGVGEITYSLAASGFPVDRVVADLVALTDHSQRVTSPSVPVVVDLVVPTGSWSISGSTVTFTGGYQPVIAAGATLHVRAPYTDANERFAHRLLRDLEMRIPAPSERANLRNLLAAGSRTRAQLVLTYTSTDVYRGIDVDRTYVDILRRANDPAGRAYWIERLRNGMALRKLRANLYGSGEYFTRYGRSDVPTYVTAAYRDILGREPDPSGLAYWVNRIRAGVPRGTVAEQFLNTAEANTVLIRDRFLRWVDREPTPAEITTWVRAVSAAAPDGELALVRFLAGSAAYYTRPDA